MEELSSAYPSLFVLAVLVWTLPWKGVALWKAARNAHKRWFIFLLVLNTLAFLEIVYIFFFSKRVLRQRDGGKEEDLSSSPKKEPKQETSQI